MGVVEYKMGMGIDEVGGDEFFFIVDYVFCFVFFFCFFMFGKNNVFVVNVDNGIFCDLKILYVFVCVGVVGFYC